MKILNRSIYTLFMFFILAQGAMPIKVEANETNLHHKVFTNELIDTVKSKIYYPQSAVSDEVEGMLAINIKIDKEGNIIGKKFTQRSGSRLLDLAAIRMIGKIQPIASIPNSLGLQEFDFEIPLVFILEEK